MSKEEKTRMFVQELRAGATADTVMVDIDNCVGCGLCASACPWYLSTQEERCNPLVRSKKVREIWRDYVSPLSWLRFKKIDIEEAVPYFFEGCTMCGRCYYVCPNGVSNRRLTWLARQATSAADMLPPEFEVIRENARSCWNTLGIGVKEMMAPVEAGAKKRKLDIPMEKTGQDWLLACSGLILKHPEYPRQVLDFIHLLNTAGVKYSISENLIDSGTEVHTACVDRELSDAYLKRIIDEFKRLGCRKGIIFGECGCDVRFFTVEAKKVLVENGIECIYMDSLLLRCIEEEKIKAQPLQMEATLHLPCWSMRLAGHLAKDSETLLKLCVSDYRPLYGPKDELNWCCGGGTGSTRRYPLGGTENNPRRQAGIFKVEQIRQTGVPHVVTPCTTCMVNMLDLVGFHIAEEDNRPRVHFLVNLVHQAVFGGE